MQQQMEQQAQFYESMMAKMLGHQEQPQFDEEEEKLSPRPKYDLAPDNHSYKRFREYNPISFKGGSDL